MEVEIIQRNILFLQSYAVKVVKWVFYEGKGEK